MTPRTKEQNETIRKQRIFQIQKTAAEVYLEKGIKLEIGDIAKKAGLGRGTVYHYYNNKLSLLEDLLNKALEEAKKITIQTISNNECPLLRLKNFAESQLNHWIKKPYLFILFKNFFQIEPIPVKNQEMLRNNFNVHVYLPVLDTIKEASKTKKIVDIDSEIASQFYFGTLIGSASAYFYKKLMNEHFSLVWCDEVVKMLIKGLER